MTAVRCPLGSAHKRPRRRRQPSRGMDDPSGGTDVAEAIPLTDRNTAGTVSELRAAAYLLERQWHVFAAINSCCPVDLIAWQPGRTPIKVEVKTLRIPADAAGTVTTTWPRNDEWDLILFVASDGIREVWAPATYRETLDSFRSLYGLGPTPVRRIRGTGAARTRVAPDRPNDLATGSEWV
jgi:hypothetical protein